MKSYQILILASLLLSACVDNGYKPVALDSNFGQSVKQISQAQYLDPKAAANPPLEVSKKLDGQLGQNIMKTYRNSFGMDAQTTQPVTINIGAGAGATNNN